MKQSSGIHGLKNDSKFGICAKLAKQGEFKPLKLLFIKHGIEWNGKDAVVKTSGRKVVYQFEFSSIKATISAIVQT